MNFGEGIKKLKEENKEYIILVKNGVFYNAIGIDALTLEKEFNLKKLCFGKNICKVGISTKKIQEFSKKLKDNDYKYIVYDYNKEKEKFEDMFVQEYRNDIGNRKIKQDIHIKCNSCSYNQQLKTKQKSNDTQEIYIENDDSNNMIFKKKTKKISTEEIITANFVKKYINNLIESFINGDINNG